MIMRRRTRSTAAGRRPRGQTLVEFAFVAPVFFFMIFAIIDFGRYVYYVQIINNAAREGARYAIVHGDNSFQPTGPGADDPKIESVVKNYAVGVIGNSAVLDINSVWGTPPGTPSNHRGQKVTVTVAYDFHPIIPLVPIPGITIKGESSLVINN